MKWNAFKRAKYLEYNNLNDTNAMERKLELEEIKQKEKLECTHTNTRHIHIQMSSTKLT